MYSIRKSKCGYASGKDILSCPPFVIYSHLWSFIVIHCHLLYWGKGSDPGSWILDTG